MIEATCIVLMIVIKILTAKVLFSVHVRFRSKCLQQRGGREGVREETEGGS